MTHRDLIVIGGGPAGAATAIRAARHGIAGTVFEKGDHGRDKGCGDGLTPRAVGALNDLEIDLGDAHQIRGLRMLAGKKHVSWIGLQHLVSLLMAQSGLGGNSIPR